MKSQHLFTVLCMSITVIALAATNIQKESQIRKLRTELAVASAYLDQSSSMILKLTEALHDQNLRDFGKKE